MKTWQWAAAVLVPGGAVVALAVWWHRRRRQRAFWNGPNYRQQIAVLRPDVPMDPPPIREPKDTVQRASLVRFRRA